MQCCRCLNKNAHPEDAEDCDERCGFCLGYCSPVTVTVIIVGLVISNLVYCALLISRNKTSAWRIVLCIIFILVPMFCGACVLWSYYVIIFTPPGYVPRDPWAHHPIFVGEGPGPDGNTRQSAANAGRPQVAPPRQSVTEYLGSDGSRSCTAEDQGASSLPVVATQAVDNSTTAVKVMNTEGHAATAGNTGSRTHSPFDPANNTNPIAQNAGAAATPRSSSPTSLGQPPAAPLNPYTVRYLDRFGNYRYCNACEAYKPDLAHHCSVCDKCVYNFDHHCPYVNNCVGRNNYKVFLVFVLYGAVGCLIALVCSVLAIFVVDRDGVMTKVGWVAIPAVELILGLALLCFYIQHQCMLRSGESTLENIIKNQKKADQGWNYWKKPKLSDEEKAAQKAAKDAKVKAHKEMLLGDEHPWYRRYLPIPVRTDVNGDGTVKQA